MNKLSCFPQEHNNVSEDRNQAQDSIKTKESKTHSSANVSIFNLFVLKGFQFSQLHETHTDKSLVAQNKIKRKINHTRISSAAVAQTRFAVSPCKYFKYFIPLKHKEGEKELYKSNSIYKIHLNLFLTSIKIYL